MHRRTVITAAVAVVAVVALGVLLRAVVLDDESDGAGGGAPQEEAATERVRPSNADLFNGAREVTFLPVGGDGALTVGDDGTVAVGPDADESSLFVVKDVSEDSGIYLLETGRVRVDGEPLCLTARKGRKPTARSCEGAANDQLWDLRPAGRADGFRTYALVTLDGLRLGLGVDRFHVADRGPSEE